ncbi:MAG: hypothetical protein ACP5I3_09490 [Thermoproteus sp.]
MRRLGGRRRRGVPTRRSTAGRKSKNTPNIEKGIYRHREYGVNQKNTQKKTFINREKSSSRRPGISRRGLKVPKRRTARVIATEEESQEED